MSRFVVLLLSLLLCTAAAAQEFSSLEERMSAADFKAAGLDKLTPAELEQLNSWLRNKGVSAAQTAAPAVNVYEDRRGFLESAPGSDEPIVSRVRGEFRGWDSRGDRIELENGQIWEVIDGSTRLLVRLTNPTVTIEPGMMNGWNLTVDGYNTRARVKRVR